MSTETTIFDNFQQLKNLSNQTSGIDLEKAKQLAFLKKDGNFRIILGETGGLWKTFVAQPELQPLTLSKADRLVKIYNTYIEKLGLSADDIRGIDSHSLYRLANMVNKDNIVKWLVHARTSSRSDLFREIRFGNIDENKCQHDWETKAVLTCKKCGTKKIKKK